MAAAPHTPRSPTRINGTTTDSTTVDQASSISYGVVGFLLFVGILVALICMKKKCTQKSRKRHNSSASSHSSLASNQLSMSEINVESQDNNMSSATWQIPDDVKGMMKGFIVDPKRLIIDKIIGKGQFGCVYEGYMSKNARNSNNYGVLTHEKVAVKTIKATGSNIEVDTVEAFLTEGMIMKDFTHPNVLGLIGVAVGEQGIPMIVLPFMEHGNLRKYTSDQTRLLVVRDLLEFGRQVAHGMDYLGQQKFVHRDLAARNCMLDNDLTVKVADFGLSRDIYTKDYYSSEDKQAKLPVKWMAIECLSKSKYTYKSDVWSYGVLLWELMTRGATPYPDVCNWDVWNYIKTGRRMRQPEACPDEIYEMMLSCWRDKPEMRPSFFHIAKDLDTILGPRATHDHQAEDSVDSCDHDYMNLYLNVDAPDSTDTYVTGTTS